ncbi:MAG: hypothetical protein N2508_02110 [Anaerolineae bacterium]|nr:hypothetical protein [Anaerolineae bacterium]
MGRTLCLDPALQHGPDSPVISPLEIRAAIRPDHPGEPVRRFATFTPDLEALADGLPACGVDMVARIPPAPHSAASLAWTSSPWKASAPAWR